jgi:hypothetical protein
MINIMLKNVDLNDKEWIELIKTINYFRNRSSMIDKSIIFLRNWHEKKNSFSFIFVESKQSITLWNVNRSRNEKKIDLKIIFDRARKIRKKSHLSNVAFQRDFLSCFVCHLNQEKTRRIIFHENLKQINKMINLWINRNFDEKQIFELNSIIIFISSSQFNQLIIVVSFFSILSTKRINTSNIESISSTFSIFSVLKRHFELRYHFDFSNLLNLLIMRCMKNVIDFQLALKSRSYKKVMNDLNRKKMSKNHEKRKQFSFDQRNLNINQFFQKSTSISRQMSLQNQKKKTRRDSALQDALNDSKI